MSMAADDPRHGTYAGSTAHYKAGEKPCLPCYAARRKYHTRYSKERGLGYVRRIPAGTAGLWQKIDDLYGGDYSYTVLAKELGCIGESRLYMIHTAGPDGLIGVKTWRALTDAIHNLTPLPTHVGTLRRLQALHALGWPIKHIMDMTGHTQEIGKRALRGEHINFSAETRRSIAAVYDRLAMTLPPTNVARGVRAAQERARRRAADMGWVAPLAWDDIDTDTAPQGAAYRPRSVQGKAKTECDPVVVMRLLEGVRIASTLAEREAALEQWVRDGGSEAELCRWHGWKGGRYSAGLRLVRGGAA